MMSVRSGCLVSPSSECRFFQQRSAEGTGMAPGSPLQDSFCGTAATAVHAAFLLCSQQNRWKNSDFAVCTEKSLNICILSNCFLSPQHLSSAYTLTSRAHAEEIDANPWTPTAQFAEETARQPERTLIFEMLYHVTSHLLWNDRSVPTILVQCFRRLSVGSQWLAF